MISHSFPKLVSLVFVAWALLAQTGTQQKLSTAECETATTTAAMRTCQNARYESAQRELEGAYQALLTRLDNEQKQKLRRTQHAWLRFRDANADFQASTVRGGTLAPLIRISVLSEMTNARTMDLKKQAVP